MEAPAIRAHLYDGRSAAAHQVSLALSGRGPHAQLHVSGKDIDYLLFISKIAIGERVGTTNRLLGLPDHASLEVLDNAAFDSALATAGIHTAEGGISRLEGRWRYALAAGVGAAVLLLTTLVALVAIHRPAVRPPSVLLRTE